MTGAVKSFMFDFPDRNRAAVYCFYDRDGIADRYVYFFLRGLKKVAGRVIVVVNGRIREDSLKKLQEITPEVICRENEGFDAWAYKTGLEYIGWENLPKYKEIICCNSSVFGPVYPFRQMFRAMSQKKDLDFWGITAHPVWNTQEFGNPYGYVPEHIQQFFCVYRRKFVMTRDFRKYWEELCPLKEFAEAIGLFETVLTKHFEDLGYRWDTYVRYDPAEAKALYFLLNDPYKALVDHKCPVLKKKTFLLLPYLPGNKVLQQEIIQVLLYLQKNRLYDIRLIVENTVREKGISGDLPLKNC